MKTHTILIADDQSVNRKLLHKLLENDYEIMEAENGQEALNLLHEHADTISAVLLDIIMPVLDGYGVLEAMKADPVLSKIPVIVASQKDGDEAEIHALELGAQDFISKPYKQDIIKHRLENTIYLRETAAIINLAEKDELTGLLRKQFFFQQVEKCIKENPDGKYDIVCIDIEHFKLVNDAYGTKTGDDLLRHFANIVGECPMAIYASRFDADHFYQLIKHQDVGLTSVINEEIEAMNTFPIDVHLNANVGVYQIHDRKMDISAMCDRAKLAATINSKKVDEAYSIYDDSIRQQLLKEQFVLGSMDEAIAERQFKVYFQPKYNLTSESLAGAEALIRWIHPKKGFMSPGEFIPIIEQNGLITKLDYYVWEETCRNLREWMDSGIPVVPISINVSRTDIFNVKLSELLLGLIRKYDIPIKLLHLEITESAYTDDPQQIISVVAKLHGLEFVIEMDDFGSGYSSLNMLAELPVDVLKMDMGFVQSEVNNTSGRGIMSFVISLAKWMRLNVVAEGVETQEQIDVLRSMDCDVVQGYYFAKPMPKNDFETLLKTVTIYKPNEEEDLSRHTSIVNGDEGRCTIMIVDDIELNRVILNNMFCDQFDIIEMENGRDALNYLKENFDKVDIVLLDLLMPVMDGFQVLEIMKKDDHLSHIPVIVTSQGDINAEERAMEMGASDFISKPYNEIIVTHRVHNVMRANFKRVR